jgi:transposase
VHERRLRLREMFVPLRHDPGHAQADFGEALAVIGGVKQKIHFFAMDLPHSDGCLVQAYPAKSSEAFCEGHNVSFEFFGGVPCSILYDNTKLAVARILGDGPRLRTKVFSELQVPLPVHRPLRASGQGQRQGQGRRVGRLRAAQLHVADPTGGKLRGAQRAIAGALPAPVGRPAARSC